MGAYDELFLQAMSNDNSQPKQSHSDIQKGKVISKEDNGYFISIGGKSEMILPTSETIGTINVGDEIEVSQIGMRDGIPQVSQKKASRFKMLEQIQHSLDNNTPLIAVITKVITNKEGANSGYGVSLDGVEAFLPLSHIRAPKDVSELVGKTFNVVVIKYERDRVVVSEKLIRDQLQKENFNLFITNHKEGDKINVIVESVNDSFALVTAENITMFLHITLFDWKYIKNLSEVLKVGDEFPVLINSIDTAKKSIRVSRKDAIENPMNIFFSTQTIGDTINATVIRFARGLAILEDSNGVELVLPVGEMSWIKKISDPKQLLKAGDKVEVKIKEMNTEKQRISVSLKDLLENPWDNAGTTYAYQTKHQGKVTSITDFGIFVVFDDGIQGLIRKEDIDWSNETIVLSERFKKGDEVSATVLNIDPKQEKLRLGIKQLSKNPLQNFADNHPIGSILSATVTAIVKDGIEVEVEDGLKAFIHISQLSTEMVSSPKDICSVGDKIQAAVRRIDVKQQRIELSIKDLAYAEDKKVLVELMGNQKNEIPTLGSMFGDILKKK